MSTRTAQLALLAIAAGGASARIRSADEFGRNAGAEQYKKFEMAEEDEVFWSRTLHGSMVHGSMSMDMGMTPEAPEESEEELLTIPATAVADGRFKTLVAALGAASLVDALGEPEPRLTVFAPTDEAFGDLPAGLVDCLLVPANVGVLTSILRYHVLAVEVFAKGLSDGMVCPTLLDGANVTVGVSDDGVVMIDKATVIVADVKASNGVIHAINSVLVPDSVDVTAFLATCGSSEDASGDVVAETAVAGASGTSPAVGDIISDQLESMMEAPAVDLEPLNNALEDSSSSRVLVGLSCLVGAFGMLFI